MATIKDFRPGQKVRVWPSGGRKDFVGVVTQDSMGNPAVKNEKGVTLTIDDSWAVQSADVAKHSESYRPGIRRARI